MKKMYKKVYVEITNNCNLNCPFCIHNKRDNKFMNIDDFKLILNKLEGITKYLYFHVLGEPLLHPLINEFIDLAAEHYKVNITTNGYLIKKIASNKNIRQLNISLHSFNEKNGKTLEEYTNDIFSVTDKLNKTTYINYRLWIGKNLDIIKKLEEKYQVKIERSMKLAENIYLDIDKPFIWPDLNNNLNKEKGKCYGLIQHFGILVDGTVIPCCLDSMGTINLGNVFNDSIENILKQKRVINMIEGFKCNKKLEELCKHCGFKE